MFYMLVKCLAHIPSNMNIIPKESLVDFLHSSHYAECRNGYKSFQVKFGSAAGCKEGSSSIPASRRMAESAEERSIVKREKIIDREVH